MACAIAILLAAVAIGTATSWAYAQTMGDGVAGLMPTGHLEALSTARVAVFLLAFQTVTVVLTFFAARWFAPAGKTLLPTRWPRLGLKALVGAGMNGLDSRRIVDMGDGRDFRPGNTEPFYTEELVVAGIGRPTAPFQHVRNDLHVRTVAVKIEPIGHVLSQHGGCERTKALAKFDPQIE